MERIIPLRKHRRSGRCNPFPPCHVGKASSFYFVVFYFRARSRWTVVHLRLPCSECGSPSITDHHGWYFCRQCYVNEFGLGAVEIKFHPNWMRAFRTTTPADKRDYPVIMGSGSPQLSRGNCICDPNNTDPSRDCPIHRPTGMTFGLDTGELRRGGLD